MPSLAAMRKRIIPARAGFTPHHVGRPARHLGSSPLARGLPDQVPRQEDMRRIIPARAGFTVRHSFPILHTRDHPRSRGVYPVEITDTLSGRGSSPLARGLPGKHLEPPSGRRIIPARAGFTVVADVRGETQWDHPRSRGVYHVRPASLLPIPGSSPLARGLREPRPRPLRLKRIIPARAGFTRTGCGRR